MATQAGVQVFSAPPAPTAAPPHVRCWPAVLVAPAPALCRHLTPCPRPYPLAPAPPAPPQSRPWDEVYAAIAERELALLDTLVGGQGLEEHMETFYLASLQQAVKANLAAAGAGEGTAAAAAAAATVVAAVATEKEKKGATQ